MTGFWADDLYVVPASGGDVKRLTTLGRGIWGHAWTPDGKNLILSCQRSGTVFGIWQFPLEHPSQLEPIRQGGIDSIMPVTSRKTGRLAWVDQLWDLNIYRAPLAGGGKPLKLISSTLRDQDAVYAPDGRIAWISDRSGSREIWISRGDGSGQTQITNFAGPQIDHLQWSPDGSRLAFDSRPNGQADIFLLACDPVAMRCGQPARVATGSPAESPSWSADGKLLYFASHRTGRAEIWKQAVSGGPPVQVSRHGGYVSHESPDGQWLYFTRIGGDSIWRVTVQPPFREELVVGPPFKVQTEGWAVTADEAVFIDRPSDKGPAAIRAYGLVSKRSRTVMDLTEVFPDRGDITVSVSPDARWILYSQLDRSGSNVFVAESGR